MRSKNRLDRRRFPPETRCIIMKFTKMHGIGNDYVYVNCFKETVKDSASVLMDDIESYLNVGKSPFRILETSRTS